MSGRRLRVALAGCGRIAPVHCAYVQRLRSAELVAACDPVPESAQRLAARFRIPRVYSDLGAMLRDIKPDVVHVLTPPATHAAVAIAALEGGAHVLVEKPLAVTSQEAEAMIAAATRAGRALCVDHNRWFDPVVQRARALLERGELGDLVGVEVFQGAAVEEVQAVIAGAGQHWAASLPGGLMHNLAPHPVYLLRNFAGPLREIRAIGFRVGGSLQEVRVAAEGARCPGAICISLRARPFMNFVRLFGSRMSVELNLNNMTMIARRSYRVPKVLGKVLPNLSEASQLIWSTIGNGMRFVTGRQRYFPGLGVLIERFYEHLRNGSPPPTTGEDGREVARILEAIWDQTAPSATARVA